MANKKGKIAVIFEVIPAKHKMQDYLDLADELKTELVKINGFISIERFQGLSNTEKLLSLSFWESEEAVKEWRNLESHRIAQSKGRNSIFQDYRLRVAHVVRDYGKSIREEAPEDSICIHD